MKKIIIAFFLLFINTCYAATEQWINSTGSGSTYDEAKNYALRNALELAFGTFVSSNTVIRNDILQNDEIVGISTGSIKKFKEISKAVINGKFCVTLNVLVSPEKLASFVKSHGMVVEYQGESYASNIKMQMMNEKAEKGAIQILSNYAKIVFSQCFDYDLKAKDPYEYMTNAWEIKMELNVRVNKNFDNLYDHIIKTLSSISLNSEEIETRKNIGKYPYVIVFNKQTGDYYGNNPEVNNKNKFTLRSNDSRIILYDLFEKDLYTSIGGVRISMDAGRYSKDVEFSPNAGNSSIKSSGNPRSRSENELVNILNADRFSYITYEVPNSNALFAKYSLGVIFKGENSVDAISNIKGFKVIK
jgi:hypothetical protein